MALQGIVTRNIDPLQSSIISVTQINGGMAYNIIPNEVKMVGTTRAFSPAVRELIERRMGQVVEGICAAHNAKGTLKYIHGYPPTINSVEETDLAAQAAAKVVGMDNVLFDHPPSMAADDVAFMLNAKGGSHVLIGNGVGPGVGEGGCAVHNPNYDFNDKILALGASFWVRMAETFLAKQ